MDGSDQPVRESSVMEASALGNTAPGASISELRRLRWRRVLLKLSGEAFAAEQGVAAEPSHSGSRDPRVGLNYATIRTIASEVVSAHRAGVEIAIVIGAGNIIR